MGTIQNPDSRLDRRVIRKMDYNLVFLALRLGTALADYTVL